MRFLIIDNEKNVFCDLIGQYYKGILKLITLPDVMSTGREAVDTRREGRLREHSSCSNGTLELSEIL